MTYFKEVGEVKKLSYEVKQFEWSIPDFFTIVEDRTYSRYDCPTFTVADTSLYLRLYPYWNSMCHTMQLNLCYHMKRECLLEYNFEIKKCDGSMEQLLGGILKGDKMCSDEEGILIQKSVILRRKAELVPGNVLTIILTVKLMTEITHSSEQTALDAARRLTLTRLDKLSDNFKDLFHDKETCDVTLRVKDKEYKVHRSVLIARSSVFAATFKHDTLERQTGIITIPDCDPDSFQKFLEYLYCGKLEELSPHSALNLYYISDKYDFEELKSFCVEYLMQCLTVENMCGVVVLADRYEETELLSASQEFFNKNLYNILATPEWECLLKTDYRLANKLMLEMAKGKHTE